MRELQAILGTAGYYKQYLPDYATTAMPLTSLVGKDREWQWGLAQQQAFYTLREGLGSAPVLSYPDPKCHYYLNTDASAVEVGAALCQIRAGQESYCVL